MSEEPDAERLKLMPACRRCKFRKIRCNRGAPKCNNCVKSNTACIIVDPVTAENYPRDYIRRLEEREKQLRDELGSPAAPEPGNAGHDHQSANDTPGSVPSSSTATRPNGFVGDGSGLGFLQSLFSHGKWKQYRPQILQHLAERPQIPELTVSRNAQPSMEEASKLLENYFTRFHIHHTFLLRKNVTDIFNKVYGVSAESPPSAQDFFRLFMVFAISAITLYRHGTCQEHPYGYYLAAQAYLGNTPLVGSLEAIENLLLVSRFGMYYHIDMSLWEISQFCVRQCVELGLHAPPYQSIDLLTEQHQRRIFWECYVLDRYSSGVLGRPFAIAGRDIGVELPVNVADETLETISADPTARLDLCHEDSLTELSVFIFCIKLRKITSRIHSEFYTGRTSNAKSGEPTPMNNVTFGHVYVKLHHYLEELESWRRSAPVFAEPRSLYEIPEWYDFMLEKDKLLLVRGAILSAPRRNGLPPTDLLTMCLESATKVIELYNYMLESKRITWTRSYFQGIFASGLSILYCVAMGVQDSSGHVDPWRPLATCGRILQRFKKEMPDAGRFAIVFQILKESLSRDSTTVAAQDHSDQSIAKHGILPTAFFGSTISPIQHAVVGSNAVNDTPSNWPAQAPEAFPTSGSSVPAMGGLLSPLDPEQGPMASFPMNMGGAANEPFLEWPMLTNEMMEDLEVGLGEFAWGATGNLDDFHMYDYSAWNL